MRFLKRISIFLLLLASVTEVKAGCELQKVQPDDSLKTLTSDFSTSFEKGLFQAVLDISKHHLSGFIFIKKTTDSSFRVVFSNQVGIKFFDFEIGRRDFIIHYCFAALDKKMLVKLLRMDFQSLIYPFEGVKKLDIVAATCDSSNFKMKNKNGKWLLTILNASGKIIHLKSLGKIIDKTRIDIKYKENSPAQISIKNPFIRLSLIMKLID